MTRSTLFDRLNQELEAFGKKAQAALDEGKLQIELLRLRRRQDLLPETWECWCIGGSAVVKRKLGGSTRCCCGWMIFRLRSHGWKRKSRRPGGAHPRALSLSPRRLRSLLIARKRHSPPRAAGCGSSGAGGLVQPGGNSYPDPVRVVPA